MTLEIIPVTREVLAQEDNAFLPLLPDNYPEAADRLMVLGAVDGEGYVYGVLAFALEYGYEYQIQWLYVAPKARRQGVASRLFDTFFDMMDKKGNGEPVTIQFDHLAPETGLEDFINAYGNMLVAPAYKRYLITREERERSELLKALEAKHFLAKPFFELSDRRQNNLLNKLEQEGLYSIRNRKEWEDECVKELCRCKTDEASVTAVIFITKNKNGNLEIGYLYASEKEALMGVLADALARLNQLYPEATLQIENMTEASGQIFAKIFPDLEPAADIYEAMWNYDLRIEDKED